MNCTGPECSREEYAKGLCQAHYRQQLRGRPLTPIQTQGEPLVVYSVRLPQHIAEALTSNPGKAREILTAAVDAGEV